MVHSNCFERFFFGSLLYHYNSGGSKTGIGDIFKNNFIAVSWRQFCIHMTKKKKKRYDSAQKF